MTLAPLLNAAPLIQAHAAFAFAVIGFGAAPLMAPKGTPPPGGSAGRWRR